MSGPLRAVQWPALLALGVLVAAGCGGDGLTHHTRTVIAQFDNGKGLYTGNKVSVLGMPVGKVTAIHPHGTGVDVTMSVDAAVRIPADVQAVTVSDSLLTDRHIELTPPYRGGPTLPDRAVLDGAHTKTPVEFESLLAMADKLSTSLGGDGKGGGPVADLLTAGANATAGNGADLRDALSALAQALQLGPDNGAATRAAITTGVTDLDELTAAAARNDRTLRDFGSGVHQLSDLLAEENFGAGDTGSQLNRIITQVGELLQQNRGAVAGLVGNSATMTKSMADYQSSLAEFLDVFPLVTDNTYNAIDHDVGALRASVDLNRVLLDGQMVKEICNLLGLKELGCATGSMKDMGPDFGLTTILLAAAGIPR
ncbi:MCE family protein [Nocardia sp. alder85J]|uniref:MCE family protein n=1 Tax=Nocardia sp. alder85J TaxID=2862949 RepID=UPI001CD30619|nr:MCE family protein [Nocardia sp. alder85J]MCX4091761.1 MCE family protein [Nocardia sp. alder85J]